MKIFIFILTLITLVSNCATTSSVHIQPGIEDELQNVRTVYIGKFICHDEIVAQAIKNLITEELLGVGIRTTLDSSKSDIVIEGTVTMSVDKVEGGVASISSSRGAAFESSTEGIYVTGVTVQFIKESIIIGSFTETQVRTDIWIPDPPEVMGRKIAKKMIATFK